MNAGLDARYDDDAELDETELTVAQLVALAAMDGGFDPKDLDPEDPDVDPPDEWLAMTPEERLGEPVPGFAHSRETELEVRLHIGLGGDWWSPASRN